MCRDQNEGLRRCPCDTSAARQLRRKNASARSEYVSSVQEKVEPKMLPVENKPYSVESVKSELEAFRNLSETLKSQGAGPDDAFAAYDKALNSLGAGIEFIAEDKYGAPTDEQLKHSVENAKELAILKKEELKKEFNLKQEEVDALQNKLSEFADRKTHPVMRERWAVWAEKDPETFAAFKAKEQESGVLSMAIFRAEGNTILEAKQEMYEKRNAAMRKALEEVGVVFADPESLEHSEDSHSDAVQSLKNSLQFYPQSWVNASNIAHNRRPLRVKRSKGRAHYSSMAGQNKFSQRTRAWIVTKPEGWQPDPHDKKESELLDMNGSNTWTDPLSGLVHESYGYGGSHDGKKCWVNVSYKYHEGDTPPKSKGWEKVEHYEEKYVPGEGYVRTGNLLTKYRKPATTRERESTTYTAELTVTKDPAVYVGKDTGMRVAMHEFAHRVEATTPKITAYEEAFLMRRSGRLPNADGTTNEPEKLTTIYKGKKELGFKDNFPSHYMGKVYDGGGYKEILSMGMETLFSGSNGGFAGVDNYSPDADYKKFILGVLASSAVK